MSRAALFTLSLALASTVIVATAEEDVLPLHDPGLVTVLEGRLRGLQELANNDKKFYSFRGIPYAEPPVGSRRFEVCKQRLCYIGQ